MAVPSLAPVLVSGVVVAVINKLGGGVKVTSATATHTIRDNDSTTVSIKASDVFGRENLINTSFEVRLEKPLVNDIQITYSFEDQKSTADEYADFVSLSREVNILAGQIAKNIDIEVIDDEKVEPLESVVLRLQLTDMINVAVSDTALEDTVFIVSNDLVLDQRLSPNGDGINDSFTIDDYGPDLYPTSSFEVYSRYGELVFKESPFQNNWKGTSNVSVLGVSSDSRLLPTGYYYYVIDRDKNEDKLIGYIYLVTE